MASKPPPGAKGLAQAMKSGKQAGKGEDPDRDVEVSMQMDQGWKKIQENTFRNWVNQHLKVSKKSIKNLGRDLSDGTALNTLVEAIAGKRTGKWNKVAKIRFQTLENVTICFKFLEKEGINLVGIDSQHVVDTDPKLILGLIWALILHYSISIGPWPELGGREDMTPKHWLLLWIGSKVWDRPVNNFTNNWHDGTLIGGLVDALVPGLCPDWRSWDPKDKVNNARKAMDLAEKWLNIPQLIRPEDMTNPAIDEMSMMTYLSQYPKFKLNDGAPATPKTDAKLVRAFGPGLWEKGNCVDTAARFIVETKRAGPGELKVVVTGPGNANVDCKVEANNDEERSYSCYYIPTKAGKYTVTITWSGQATPKSPYTVSVASMRGDASKCTAQGKGVSATGCVVMKMTSFTVTTKGAGAGVVDVAIIDPSKNKRTIIPVVTKKTEETWEVRYMPREEGLHSINVFFAGKVVPKSPFGVGVKGEKGPYKGPPATNAEACPELEAALASRTPPTTLLKPEEDNGKPATAPAAGAPAPGAEPAGAFDASKVYCTGRGIQPKGVRVKDNAVFRIHTENAGQAEIKIQILGPKGAQVQYQLTAIDNNTSECAYVPTAPTVHSIIIMFGGQGIPKSPYKVSVGPAKDCKIKAYGPGLEGGVVGKPATFIVETFGDTTFTGFSIDGPSKPAIDCKKDADGLRNAKYIPTVAGEYAIHILWSDKEDIPKSPYMAMIVPADPAVDPSKVTASGPGLQKTGVMANSWAEFTVDTKKTGKAPLKITCLEADFNPVEVTINDKGDGTFACKYMPTKAVKYTLIISYGGLGIPNSPFRVQVGSAPGSASDASQVKVSGPAVEGPVKANVMTYMTIDVSKAGPGDLAVAVTDEQNKEIPVKKTDNKNGTFKVEFNPTTPGTKTATVTFGGQQVPKSPFKVTVQSGTGAGKVLVRGLGESIPIGKETEFEVVTKGAGQGQATVTLISPSKKSTPAKITAKGMGCYKATL